MTDAPKTIWIETTHIPDSVALDQWDVEPIAEIRHCFTSYTRTDSIPSPDAIVRAALEAAMDRFCEADICDEIRALRDDPDALAAIIAKAGERG
jgi:hypothetical protein